MPGTSARNFTPTSTALASLAAATAGAAVLAQIVLPVVAAAVVNDQVEALVMAVPDRSLTPLTVAVYVVFPVSATLGVSVAVKVLAL